MTLLTASLHSYKTAKGTRWCIRWRENGKQRHETVPGYGRQAKEIARERASEIELGRHYVAPPQTLEAFLGEWLRRQENQVKPSTLKRKREALRALGVLSEGNQAGASGGSRVQEPRSPGRSATSVPSLPSESTYDDLVTGPAPMSPEGRRKSDDIKKRPGKPLREKPQPLSAAAVEREARAERETKPTRQAAPEHGGGHIPSEEELDRMAREAE